MARMRTTNVAEVAQLVPVGLPGPQPHWAGEQPAPRQRARAARTAASAPKRKPSSRATNRWQRLSHSLTHENRPLTLALLLSLLIHALLLNLTFGDHEFGLPGFAFPWRERRIEVPDLRIVLVPAHVTPAAPAIQSAAGPKPQASIEQPVARGPAPTPTAPARADGPDHAAPPPQIAKSSAVVDVVPPEAPTAFLPAAPPAATPVIAVAPSDSSPEPVTSASREAVDGALEAARLEAARVEVARLDAERQEAARWAAAQLEAERRAVARQEAARVEAARLEVERQEAARQAAAQLEAQQQEAARQVAARVEAARLEAERQAAARQAAAQLDAEQQQESARQTAARAEAERQAAARQAAAQLQEAARQATARAEAARLEAERQEAARRLAAQMAAQLEAQRQEAARQEAARVEAAGLEAARQAAARVEAARVKAEQEDVAARREAALRAIGRQLDEEAARRDAAAAAARQPSTLPLSLSTARRFRLWGRTDPNAELIQYAEAWARKIQFNTAVDTVRELAKRPHTTPMVTVAIRSDGSVESVTFILSSGVAEVDEAIRRIVHSHAHYAAFPPALASEYDVIEIRRTWTFDVAVRMY